MRIGETGSILPGDRWDIIAANNQGTSGTIRDLNLSKTGHLKIAVVQDNGVRFKALHKNVVASARL